MEMAYKYPGYFMLYLKENWSVSRPEKAFSAEVCFQNSNLENSAIMKYDQINF